MYRLHISAVFPEIGHVNLLLGLSKFRNRFAADYDEGTEK